MGTDENRLAEMRTLWTLPDQNPSGLGGRQSADKGAFDRRSTRQKRGEPFVGRSGQLLDKMLAVVDLDRKRNIYITNIVKCRPPENRDPAPEEVAACLDYLREQTRILAPKIIVCLGRISATRIIDPGFKVTKQHGQWVEKGGIHMMGTFHPAALLRNPVNKPGALEDFLGLREKIRQLCPEVYEL